ncbi:hypothetical protein AB0O76_40520 [Streptomyces sp. NPDC086554]
MSSRLPRLCLSTDDIAHICEVLEVQGDELVYALDNGQEIVLTPVEVEPS